MEEEKILSEISENSGKSENSENSESPENSESAENSESSEKSESSENSESTENSENSENFESSEKSDNSESTENSENSESSENSENSEIPESSEISEPATSRFKSFDAIAAAFAKGRGIPQEIREKTLETIHSIADSLDNGELAIDIFETIRKGLDYDAAVSRAAADGELKGRNAKIDELYFREIPDDGLPHFRGTHAAVRKDTADSIFDLARQA